METLKKEIAILRNDLVTIATEADKNFESIIKAMKTDAKTLEQKFGDFVSELKALKKRIAILEGEVIVKPNLKKLSEDIIKDAIAKVTKANDDSKVL